MSNEQILKPKSHLFGRLRLLILSLPFVGAVLLLRFVIQEIFNVSEVATFAEIGSVITGLTLILGFMLGGVLADYKESERLPASLAVALSGFAATANAGMTVKDISDPAVQQRIAKVGQAMREWFFGRLSLKLSPAALIKTTGWIEIGIGIWALVGILSAVKAVENTISSDFASMGANTFSMSLLNSFQLYFTFSKLDISLKLIFFLNIEF